MKKLLNLAAILTAITVLINPTYAEEKKENSMPENTKILIAYYSWSGNTKEVAEAIQEKTGGTLFQIETTKPYPEEYRATTEQAKKEINDGFRPELKDKVADISQYDVIFIGSPNWWGTIAPAVSSFLASYNLKGKKIIPFITHGGGGVQNTIKDLTAQCTECNVVSDGWVGYSSRTFGISGWLKDIGFNK
ncbi:MAG: hypothetical protein NC218_00480 [Acetobacter sp.]|nr:hypothetical protein [Acetobacter sp.]